jgi:hypothetical protein
MRMPQYKLLAKTRRLVWRISDRAPLGEWVDPAVPVEPTKPKTNLPEVSSGSFVRSSFDLLSGIDMDDGPNTVPDDLFDELFPAAPSRDPKASKDR